MSTTTPVQVARRPVILRIGLVLAALLAVGGTIPAVFDIGFDGTGWDVVVVLVAIISPLILVATVVLLPFAWRGRRAPSLTIIGLQLAAILPALPPYLHAPGELPPEAAISATIGIALNLVAVALIALGMQPRRQDPFTQDRPAR
jgi:hypothetical protein